MGLIDSQLNDALVNFIKESPMFFVATAPLSVEAHINCSPRPVDSRFLLKSERQIGWFDLVGSGIETIAHLKENSRIVLMFCSFTADPLILRIHGSGRVFEPGDEEFDSEVAKLGSELGIRAMILVDVESVSTSCGYGVPIMKFESHREKMDAWLELKGPSGLRQYKHGHNLSSIDNLEGLDSRKIY